MNTTWPDARGYYGEWGGRFVAETLMEPLRSLEAGWNAVRQDPSFRAELDDLLANYVGRPTPLTPARRLSAHAGGAAIWLKREDLTHTGAHKINNALGQALLARRLGKTRLVAETARVFRTALPGGFLKRLTIRLAADGRLPNSWVWLDRLRLSLPLLLHKAHKSWRKKFRPL